MLRRRDQMKIIGIIGSIGSGKDFISEHISKKYNFKVIHTGEIVRNIAKNMGLMLNRNDLLSVSKKCYNNFGKKYFVNIIISEIRKADTEFIIINSIRSKSDVELLKKEFGNQFVLVYIKSGKTTRFNRLINRGDDRDPITFEEFLKQEADEEKTFSTNNAIKLADYQIENNQSTNELFNQIQIMMKQLYGETHVSKKSNEV